MKRIVIALVVGFFTVGLAGCFLKGGPPAVGPTSIPPTAVPAGSDRYGVSQGAHRDASLMPRSFELAGQAGIGWIRFGIWYDIASPRPDTLRYKESGFDDQVSKARQEGLQILGMLAFATQWNTSAPPNLPPQADPTHFPPRDYQAWADYVFQTVSRYKDDIQYWEVWNEPDLQSFWAGTPAQYAELLAVTYDAIKRANPQAKVVLGGLALGGRRVNPNFLAEILSDARYPAARYFDIMNFHHYGSRQEARQKMEYVRNALAQVGALDKPIWITETGYSSDPSRQKDPNYQGLEGQAQWLRDMLPYLLGDLRADKVFWYRLYDYPDNFNADVGARYYGLIDNQGNPKPSYFAYQELIESSSPASVPPASATLLAMPKPTPSPAAVVSPIGFTLTYSEENQQLFDNMAQPDDRLAFFRAHVLMGKGWPPRLTQGKVITTWPSWIEARQYEDRWAPYADVFGYDIEADSPPDEIRNVGETINELQAYLADVSQRYGHPIKLSTGLNYNFGTRYVIELARSDEVHLHANELLRLYPREDRHGLNYVEWVIARAAEVRAANPDVDIVVNVLVPEMEAAHALEVAQALLSAMATGRLRFEGFTLWANAEAAKSILSWLRGVPLP